MENSTDHHTTTPSSPAVWALAGVLFTGVMGSVLQFIFTVFEIIFIRFNLSVTGMKLYIVAESMLIMIIWLLLAVLMGRAYNKPGKKNMSSMTIILLAILWLVFSLVNIWASLFRTTVLGYHYEITHMMSIQTLRSSMTVAQHIGYVLTVEVAALVVKTGQKA